MKKHIVVLCLGVAVLSFAVDKSFAASEKNVDTAKTAETKPFETQSFDGISFNLTPESTIQSLVAFYDNDTLYSSAWLVVGRQVGDDLYLKELTQNVQKDRGALVLSNSRPTFKVRDNEAIASYQLTLKSPLFPETMRSETLTLRRSRKKEDEQNPWKIVPGNAETVFNDPQSGYLLRLATYLSNPFNALQKIQAARYTNSLKVLMTAIAQASQEDEVTVLHKESWKQTFMPYIDFKTMSENDPDAHVLKWSSLNENIDGKRFYRLVEGVGADEKRAKLVVLYDGENQKLRYSFDGRAPVAFADGHVALVSPQEAKTLIWKIEPSVKN